MKSVKIAGLFVALMLMGMGTASAVPTVNGTIDGAEWDVFNLGGNDGNEAGIDDSWDIATARFIHADDGAATDGWYFLMTAYAALTFAGGPGAFDEAYFTFALDFNNDGDVLDAEDRLVRFNRLGGGEVQIFAGTGGVALGTGTGVLGDVIEVYADESLFPAGANVQGFAALDGSGTQADDQIPNQGFFTPIPEPTSMLLIGMGLLGGVARKKLGLF